MNRYFIAASFSENIKVVAVSKTKSTEKIKEIYDLGQETLVKIVCVKLVKKHEDLSLKDINWHMIGKIHKEIRLNIAPFIHLIHSVDSERLLNQINKEEIKNNRIINVFIANKNIK